MFLVWFIYSLLVLPVFSSDVCIFWTFKSILSESSGTWLWNYLGFFFTPLALCRVHWHVCFPAKHHTVTKLLANITIYSPNFGDNLSFLAFYVDVFSVYLLYQPRDLKGHYCWNTGDPERQRKLWNVHINCVPAKLKSDVRGCKLHWAMRVSCQIYKKLQAHMWFSRTGLGSLEITNMILIRIFSDIDIITWQMGAKSHKQIILLLNAPNHSTAMCYIRQNIFAHVKKNPNLFGATATN